MPDPSSITVSSGIPLTETVYPALDRLNVLYIRGPLSPPAWLSEALAFGPTDAIGVADAPSLREGLERLREQAFDVVVIDRDASDRPAAELLLAIHASTHEHQAVLVLADTNDRSEAMDYLLAGASGYLSLRQTTTQELIWQLHWTAQRARLEIENMRLRAWQQRYREQEQGEVLSLLEEQSTILGVAARLREQSNQQTEPAAADPCLRGTIDLTERFREILQAYIVMGRGQMSAEVQRLAIQLQEESRPVPQTIRTFTSALQSLVRARGARSSRHVFHRGTLLLLDLLVHWADRSPRRESA